jgi:hypothetical protein
VTDDDRSFAWWSDLNDPDLHQPTRPMLYHYTDAAGLTGFVKSKCELLATHHQYVNDSDEINFGHKIAIDVLIRLGLHRRVIETAIAKTDDLLKEPSFIACLSENWNVLPQWRLYANDTAGYCLGFKDPESKFYSAGEDEHLAYTLCECKYGAPKLRARLEERFRRKIELIPNVKRLQKVSDDERNEVLAGHLAQVAWRYAQLSKHEHFQFESEWRFVVSESNPVIQYRLTRRGLTPHLFSDKLELAEVWVGPGIGPTPEKACEDVSEFLAKHALSATVRPFVTSYRR